MFWLPAIPLRVPIVCNSFKTVNIRFDNILGAVINHHHDTRRSENIVHTTIFRTFLFV